MKDKDDVMRIATIILTTMLLLAATAAQAGTASAYLQVTVTVVPNCQISVNDLAFGLYDPLLEHGQTPLDATADVRMRCTKNSQVAVSMDFGRGGVGANRMLSSGNERLQYDLYVDASRTRRWANGENALRAVGAGGSDSQLFTVFGRIPPGQEVPPGPYADVVTATVDF